MRETNRTIEKKLIFYTRDYRRFPKAGWVSWVYVLFLVIPATLVFVFFYPQISSAICGWTAGVLRAVVTVPVSVASASYFGDLGPIYFVDMEGTFPTPYFALLSLIVCFVFFLIVTRAENNARSLMIFLAMGLFVQLISSAFFLFFPEYFPYTLTEYSELYMKQQICIWLMITLICGLTTALVRSGWLSKFAAFFLAILYSLLYGISRYVVYLFVLQVCSSLFMAMLFFTFGVLFDFLQLVMVYSFFTRGVSRRGNTKEGSALWEWS